MPRAPQMVAGLILAVTFSACSSTPAVSSRPPAAPTTTAGPLPIAPASSGSAVSGIAPIPQADLSPAGAFGSRPTVKVPSGSPPAQLEAWDLIVGTGATATDGETVDVQYDGYSWTNKGEFDASWNRGQAFPFTLGEGQVIKGWDEGVLGMKVGGRRELVIPPSLAYGAQGRSPAIAPNDTLIFVVDLVSIGSSGSAG